MSRNIRTRAHCASAAKRRGSLNPGHRSLRFEALEDRLLLATITVNTIVDQNDGIVVGGISLRDAIAAAAPNDTINFAASLTSGGPATIQLLNIGGAQLTINKNLTIDGPGANLLTINAFDPTPAINNADGSRVFNVDDGNPSIAVQRTVAIGGLTLSGGDVNGHGGAVRNAESLTLSASVVTGNVASFAGGGIGGGIYNGGFAVLILDGVTVSSNLSAYGGGVHNQSGSVTVANSTISGNVVTGNGGGIQNNFGTLNVTGSTLSGNNGTGAGGGILSYFDIATNVTDTTISGNIANHGGGIWSRESDVTLTGSTISGNVVAGNGGGIFQYNGSLTVAYSAIGGNDSAHDGGGIWSSGSFNMTSSLIYYNDSANDGGGIFKSGGTLNMIDGWMFRNSSISGAGIYNSGGDLTIAQTDILQNSAQLDGGGIFSTAGGDVTLVESTISGNSADYGGGISHEQGNLTINGSTIDGNLAAFQGGGILTETNLSGTQTTTIVNSTIANNYADQSGGGVFNGTGLTVIRNSTIAGNANGLPLAGGGVASRGNALTLTQVYSSIISGNFSTGGGGDVDFVDGALNSFQSLGYNLIGNGNALGDFNQTGDQTGITNPLLAPLGDHGGPTRTMAPTTGSAAIDRGNPADIAGLGGVPQFDQRGSGFTRVAEGDGSGAARIDVGAFERQGGTAVSLVVDTLFDEDDGDFSAGDLSLREAIRIANGSLGADSISFAPSLAGGTIGITRGELLITDQMTISGLGAGLLTIDALGNNLSPDDGDGSRVFLIRDGNDVTTIDVEISGLRLTGGDVSDNGGAISNYENLDLIGCTITGNFALGEGGGASNTGNLTMSGCTIDGNTAGGGGGGIHNVEVLTVSSSTVSSNSAHDDGGGIASNGNLIVIGSTISGNSAGDDGGGVFANSGLITPTTTITNSTISGNFSSNRGGGLFNLSGLAAVRRSTIHYNSTLTGASAGIASAGDLLMAALTQVYSSIVAGNGTSDVDFVNGVFNSFQSLGYNLIGTGNALGEFNKTGDQVGADPMLGSLADSGGPTKTHMPLPGSPAIDAGLPSPPGAPFFDQRGFPFIRVFDGNGMAGPQIDIGAYEIQTVANLTLVVDTLVDEYDGNYSAGDLSLREAVSLANGSAGPNTIAFASSLTSSGPAAIQLSLGEMQIRETLTLTGPGAALLSIDASASDPTPMQNNGDGSRIFEVDDDLLGSNSAVFTISGLTLTGGDNPADGGAIEGNKTLVISNCVIIGNAADDGGGIYIDEGTMTMTNCTVIGNFATSDGGGIYQDDGKSIITSSVIQGNTAVARGGGIANIEEIEVIATTISGNFAAFGGGIVNLANLIGTESAKIIGSTISGNTATNRGGGVYSQEGLTTVRFSTITDNNAPNGMGSGFASRGDALTRTEVHSSIIAGNDHSDVDYVNGGSNSFLSMGYNLIGGGNATMIPLNAFNQTGDQVGANPLLGPLAANGGPTMTHALLPGSPAIDAGNPAAAAGVGDVPLYDQRGNPFGRVIDGNSAGGAQIDKGAFELQPLPAAFFGDNNGDDVVDAADYLVWRKTLGTTGVAAYSGADGDGDSVIDQDDYGVWRAHFGMTIPAPGTGSGAAEPTFSAPEIEIREATVLLSTESTPAPVETDSSAARAAGFAMLDHPSRWQDSGLRSRGRIQRYGLAESGSDDLLLLAVDRVTRFSEQDTSVIDDRGSDPHRAGDRESQWLIDESPAVAFGQWRWGFGHTSVARH